MSMWAASESSASEPASRPATTSTPMNPAISSERDGQPAAVGVGRRRVRVLRVAVAVPVVVIVAHVPMLRPVPKQGLLVDRDRTYSRDAGS